MDAGFGLSPEVDAFRREVGAYLGEVMGSTRVAAHLDPTDLTGVDLALEREIQRECGRRGWLGISVPTELGGGGRPLTYQAMFSYESAYHDAPTIDTAITLAGAPLTAHASPEQRERLIAPMLAGEVNISIGYTEAGAGSDLTRISTAARKVSDGWELTGTKTLVTGAHKSTYALIIARTDPEARPRDAMTMFVVDLVTAGVTVHRRTLMNGWTLGDIDLDHVIVDEGAVLGEVGAGWRQMASALLAERSGVFNLGFAQRRFDDLSAHVGDDPSAAATLADLRLDLVVAERFVARVLDQQENGVTNAHHPAASKIAGTELLQRIATVGTRLLGLEGLVWGPLLDRSVDAPLAGRLAWEYLDRVRETISVGNNELQRTTVARAELARDDGATPATTSTPRLAESATGHVAEARWWGAASHVDPHLATTLLPALVLGHLTEVPIGWAEVDDAGHCPYVPAGTACERFVAVRGGQAWSVDSAIDMRPVDGIGDDGAAAVSLDLGAATMLGPVAESLGLARLCLAAAMHGACESALRDAVAWITTREQFGAPLSTIGAVQQHVANMRLATDAVGLTVDDAARRIDDGEPAAVLGARAKALADRECAEIVRLSHQLLGGAGLAFDHPAHRRYRLVKVAEHLAGPAAGESSER